MSEEKLKKIGYTVGYLTGVTIKCCVTVLIVVLTASAIKHLLFQERKMNRKEILDTAAKCVLGDREQDYGTPESNFALIALLS